MRTDVLQCLGRIHNKNDAFYVVSESQEGGIRQHKSGYDVRYTGAVDENVEGYREAVHFPKAGAHFPVQPADRRGHGVLQDDVQGRQDHGACSGDPDREMYHTALAMMKEAGYEHYEISNAALPGF